MNDFFGAGKRKDRAVLIVVEAVLSCADTVHVPLSLCSGLRGEKGTRKKQACLRH